MKKIFCVGLLALAIAVPVLAVESSVVLNTTNGQVFGISYESGMATVTVAGVVNASSIAAPAVTWGSVTVQSNLTLGTTTKFPSIAAATGTPVAAASVLLPEGYSTNAARFLTITVGTTNYVIPAYVKP